MSRFLEPVMSACGATQTDGSGPAMSASEKWQRSSQWPIPGRKAAKGLNTDTLKENYHGLVQLSRRVGETRAVTIVVNDSSHRSLRPFVICKTRAVDVRAFSPSPGNDRSCRYNPRSG